MTFFLFCIDEGKSSFNHDFLLCMDAGKSLLNHDFSYFILI